MQDEQVLSPPLAACGLERKLYLAFAEQVSRLSDDHRTKNGFSRAVDELLSESCGEGSTPVLRASILVLSDLARQRWSIRVSKKNQVLVSPPAHERFDRMAEKERIREQELVKRDEQLRQPATRAFVQRMERKSVHAGRFVSIYSLFREGRELARSLCDAGKLGGEERTAALKEAISPYIQLVDDSRTCEFTGLRLQDIWRYFRHTWSNQYTTAPGRSMAFLVRDRAAENHPVIGIGALASPIVQISERDRWIGWDHERFLESMAEAPPAALERWLQAVVEKAINELYVVDLIEDGLLVPADLRNPTAEIVERLAAFGESQRKLHHRMAGPELKRGPGPRDPDASPERRWQSRARTHLYRSKRALALADMLKARMVIRSLGERSSPGEGMGELLLSAEGRRVIKRVLRKAKADRVGIAMADISVCGAVAPYGPILGGKLVAMLAASPQIVAGYRSKYSKQESEIASSMAGRPVVRPSDLVFLGTTSLYAVGSSQYNRIRIPAERLGGEEGDQISYLELGKSESYGTSHFSSETVGALVELVRQSKAGQRVNSIFGEGVSPKLRKVRDGLNALDFPSDALLRHGRRRIVYGVPLVRNLREYLLGLAEEPDYLFDLEEPEEGTARIVDWWFERWLQKRVSSEEALSNVAKHSLVRPIRHGARVNLPRVDQRQGDLFDDLEP